MELSPKSNILLVPKRKIIIEERLLLGLRMKKKNVYYRVKKWKYFLIKLKYIIERFLIYY